jgi:hypothetical protein
MLHVKCLACLSCHYGTTCMDLHSHENKARYKEEEVACILYVKKM